MKGSELLKGILNAEPRALARAISWVENGVDSAGDLMRDLYPHTGRAHVLGVTGSPGVGKSTLVNALVVPFRKAGKTVGIIAVDPSSPFSGGALLGDRIRMQRHGTDRGVFIRSLASRGCLGGLSRATGDIIRLVDAYGFDVIMVETVGSGQVEVEVMKFSHTVAVVTAPGLGDKVQVMKAGIMEIGDIFVVNKADREGAESTVREIRSLWEGYSKDGWIPPVLPVVAIEEKGIDELYESVVRHRRHLVEGGSLKSRITRGLETELREQLKEATVERILAWAQEDGNLKQVLEEMHEKTLDPRNAAEKLLKRYGSRCMDL